MLDPQQSQQPIPARLLGSVPDSAAQRCAFMAEISRDTNLLREHRLSILLRYADALLAPDTVGKPVASCVVTGLSVSLARLWAVAAGNIALEESQRLVLDTVLKTIVARITEFSPQELVHLSDALRAMKVEHGVSVKALARVSDQKMWELSPGRILDHLLNLYHLGLKNADFFHDAGVALASSMDCMERRDVYRLVGVLLVNRIRDDKVFQAFAEFVQAGLGDIDFDSIVTTLRVCARGGYRDELFFAQLARRACELGAEFNRKPLLEALRLFSQLEVREARPFFAIAASRVQALIPELTPNRLVQVVHNYAVMNEFQMPLMRAVSSELVRQISHLSIRELSHVGWAYAALSIRDDRLLNELRNAFVGRLHELPADGYATLAWAFSSHAWRDKELFSELSSCAQRRLLSIDSRQLSTLAWSFANVGIEDRQLFESIAAVVLKRESHDPAVNARIAWAFAASAPDLAGALCSAQDLDRIRSPREWHQVYQALLVTGQVPPAHRPSQLKSLKKMDGPGRSGKFELAVVEALVAKCGISPRDIDQQRHVAGIQTDLIVYTPGKPIIIECDGDVFHRTVGPDGGTPIGRDLLQDRIFATLGYEVLHILASEFYGEKRADVITRIQELVRKQAQAAPLPPGIRRILP